MKEITVANLQEWIQTGKDFQLIDVREPYEYDIANLGGILIPKNKILDHLNEFNSETDIVIHCRSGKRSHDVIEQLNKHTRLKNLYNLKGGILAWANEIDPTMPKY